MKFLSTFAILAAGASALPTAAAPPAKFAIQVTATLKSGPVSLYLKKGVNGDGTFNLAEAAACSLNGDKLACDGKIIGAQATAGLPDSTLDMAPLAEAISPTAIVDRFSVDGSLVLHFKSPKFDKLTEKVAIQTKQGGEAQFGLFDMSNAGPLAALTGVSKAIRLYSQLGCPAGTHDGLHGELVVGKSKIVPL